MNRLSLIVVPALIAQVLFAFEPDMLNLSVPSQLEKTEMVFRIAHRFYGELTDEPLETFFGLDDGANVSLVLRYALFPRLELSTSYTRLLREYTIGASYAYYVPRIVKTQLDVQFFDFQPVARGERRQNFFYNALVQTEPIARVIIPAINIGYDGYEERFGFGAGILLGFEVDLTLLQKVSIIGEYYPVIDRDEEIHGAYDSFAAGIKLETYGHHFMLMVGNSFQIGPRRMMLGAGTNDLRFGFNVHRVIDL